MTDVVAGAVMKRSQGLFVQQWRRTGKLNAHIEEAFSGHTLVSVYGRRPEIEKTFAEQNEQLYTASFSAQFVSGLVMPLMMFVAVLLVFHEDLICEPGAKMSRHVPMFE